MSRLVLTLLMLAACVPAHAGTVYKCLDGKGQVTYQASPCAKLQHEQVMQLPDTVETAPSPAAAASAPEDAPSHPSLLTKRPAHPPWH